MGTYYYLKNPDPHDEWGMLPVADDDYVDAIFRIAKKSGVKITEKMILDELGLGKKLKKTRKSKRVHLYVDGTNLFAGQNELFGPKKYVPFPLLLRAVRRFYPVSQIHFYASYMIAANWKKPGRKEIVAAEGKFYHSVRETKKLDFYRGHRSPSSGREKGVDVHLAVDLVRDALTHVYDEAVIWSGDADLSYAVEIVRTLHIPVHAVFLPNRFSLGIAHAASSSIVLNYQKRFVGRGNPLPRSMKITPIKDPTCVHVG